MGNMPQLAEIEQRYGPEAVAFATELVKRMSDEQGAQQHLSEQPSVGIISSIRNDLKRMYPDRHVVPADEIYKYDRIAGLRGAGFTSETDAPAALLRRLGDNDEFFWRDTETSDDEYDFTSRTFALSQERLIERLSHRYSVVGKTSLSEFLEYDNEETK